MDSTSYKRSIMKDTMDTGRIHPPAMEGRTIPPGAAMVYAVLFPLGIPSIKDAFDAPAAKG
jgi:hypothetical protein